MCLDRISTSHAQPSSLIVDAWKEFSGTGTALKFENFPAIPITLDAWIQATDKSAPQGGLRAGDGKMYRPGFHAYADEGDKPWRSRRVYLRRITSEGTQGLKRAVVAQEMYVPSDPNAWPPQAAAAPPSPPPAEPPKQKLTDRLRKKIGGKP